MESKIIAEFEYKGKTYVYYKESDNTNLVKYGILENDTIVDVKDPKDIEIMNEAGKQIFISSNINDHIKVGIITYNGKQYQQMLDLQSKFKFFYEIKDGKYYLPADEEAAALFEIFNSHDLYMANTDSQIYSSAELRKFLKNASVEKAQKSKSKSHDISDKATKTIFIAGLSILALVAIPAIIRNTKIEYDLPVNGIDVALNTINSKSSEAILEKAEQKYDEAILINAIDSNNNLSFEEKEMYKDHVEFIRKYSRYVKFNELINAISNGNINYHNYSSPGRSGDYIPETYSTNIYDSTGFSDAPKSVLGHEIGHNFSGAFGPFCSGTFEATNEIVNSEKGYADDVSAYYEIIAFQKILIEIIGEIPFAAFNQSGNIYYIIDALGSKIDDKYLPYQLLAALDNVIIYNDIIYNWHGKYNEKQIEEARVNIGINNKFIIDTLSKYFEAEKGYQMNEDLVAMLYLNSINAVDVRFKVSNGTDSTELGYGNFALKKGYFLDSYINKYPEHTLIFFTREGEEIRENRVTINDSNRRVVPNNGIYDIGMAYYAPKQVENNQSGASLGGSISGEHREEPQAQSVEYSYEGRGIAEALNELFIFENSSEDQKKIPENRIEQVTYLKILYEIIGKEPFEKFVQSNFDSNEIIKALTNLIPDKEMANELINYIDSISDYNNNKGLLSQEEWDKKLNGLSGIRSQIDHFLYIYFESANGYMISDDALISFYYLEMQNKVPDISPKNHYYRVRDVNGNEIIIRPNDGTKVEVSKSYIFSSNNDAQVSVKITPQGSESSIYVNVNNNNRDMKLEKNITDRFQFYFDEGIDKEK